MLSYTFNTDLDTTVSSITSTEALNRLFINLIVITYNDHKIILTHHYQHFEVSLAPEETTTSIIMNFALNAPEIVESEIYSEVRGTFRKTKPGDVTIPSKYKAISKPVIPEVPIDLIQDLFLEIDQDIDD